MPLVLTVSATSGREVAKAIGRGEIAFVKRHMEDEIRRNLDVAIGDAVFGDAAEVVLETFEELVSRKYGDEVAEAIRRSW